MQQIRDAAGRDWLLLRFPGWTSGSVLTAPLARFQQRCPLILALDGLVVISSIAGFVLLSYGADTAAKACIGLTALLAVPAGSAIRFTSAKIEDAFRLPGTGRAVTAHFACLAITMFFSLGTAVRSLLALF